MRLSLGVDPSSSDPTGIALVDLDAVAVVAWWVATWSKDRHVYRVRSSLAAEWDATSLHHVAIAVWAAPRPWRLVVEALFEGGSMGKRVKRGSGIKAAEAAGELLGPLRKYATEILRPPSVRHGSKGTAGWRDLIGAAELDSDRAEEIAIAVARDKLVWPDGLDLLTEKELGAACESAIIACFPLAPW